MRELTAERVSVVAAKATEADALSSGGSSLPPTAAKAAASAQMRQMKVLKREPMQVRLSEGRGVVLEQYTAEECSRMAREARRALEERRTEREMAENKVERPREEEWALERADLHTPEERARDEVHTRSRLTRYTSTCCAICHSPRTTSAR